MTAGLIIVTINFLISVISRRIIARIKKTPSNITTDILLAFWFPFFIFIVQFFEFTPVSIENIYMLIYDLVETNNDPYEAYAIVLILITLIPLVCSVLFLFGIFRLVTSKVEVSGITTFVHFIVPLIFFTVVIGIIELFY